MKVIIMDKWIILGPKMAHPQLWISSKIFFLTLCRVEGANRYMKILLVFFREKNPFGAI